MAALETDFTLPLRDFALELGLRVEGTVALVGPSGAGKTSVLRALAGLVRPSQGRVTLGDEVWLDTARGVDLPPERRRAGLVFQEYALFPHLSVRANVAYGAGRRPVGALLVVVSAALLVTVKWLPSISTSRFRFATSS